MDHQQHCYAAAPTARWERPLPLEVIPPHLWHEKLNIFICFGKKQIQIYGQSRPQTWNILPSVVAHVHHVINIDPNLCGALTSLWKQTEIWGGLVRESPEGPPGASSFSFTSKKAPAEVWIMDNKCAFWCLPPPGPIPSCHREEKKQKRADCKSR